MRRREASINDVPITEAERQLGKAGASQASSAALGSRQVLNQPFE